MATKVELKSVRTKIAEVVDLVGEAVGATMGPGGQSVLLETQAGMPIITKDGVTVANSIDLKDPELGLVARIIKQAADKTNREAGDGTTTATVLAKEIYSQGHQLVAAGHNSTLLKKQMDAAKVKLLKALDDLSVRIPEDKQYETLKHIAKISMNGEEGMADIIAEAVSKTGVNGLVKVVDNTKAEDELVTVKGLEFNSGWASPFFAERNDSKVIIENAAIFITSHKLTTLHQLSALEPALTYFMQKNIPVVFIASEVSGVFLTNLVANQKKGSLKNVAVRPPYFGIVRKEFFTDLAAATGATVIEAEEKMDLSMTEAKHFGYAKRVEVSNIDCTIIEGAAKKEVLAVRIDKLKELAEKTEKGANDLDKVHERLAKLSGSVMLIKVARESQVEVEERKHRIEDALNATKAALEQGYVPGGGAALYYAVRDLFGSELPGDKLLSKALQYPAKKILSNAGFSDKELYPLEKGEIAKTINAVTGKECDAYSHGIIDPVKVTKAALSNAISVAGTLLTTNVIVSRVPEQTAVNPFETYGY